MIFKTFLFKKVMMKRANALVGIEVREHFKKCKMSTHDFILNSAKNISNYSEFEAFMTFLSQRFQIKVDRSLNDECVTISLNEMLLCSLTKNNFYEYDNFDEDLWTFFGELIDELILIRGVSYEDWEDYLDKLEIPQELKTKIVYNRYANLLFKAYYLEPKANNAPLI